MKNNFFKFLKKEFSTGANKNLPKFNIKKTVSGVSLAITLGTLIYLENKNKTFSNLFFNTGNNNSLIYCLDKNAKLNLIENLNDKLLKTITPTKENRIFISNNPTITIIYDDQNELQTELTEIIFEKLNEYYLTKIYKNPSEDSEGELKIKIEKVSIQSDSTILEKNKLQQLDNKNEPIVLIKNDYLSETINPYSFTKYSNSEILKDKLQTKINNIISFKKVNSFKEMREEFRYLENPKNKIILVTSNMLNDFQTLKSISLFRNKNTKILLINNKQLQEDLLLEDDKVYQYYPAKLPYKMNDTDLYLKEFFSFKTKNPNVNVHEYLSKDGMDLNTYLNTNATSLMLKLNMFRDEIKISKDLLLKQNIPENNFLEERIKLQKLISYPKRNVSQLAETNKQLIKSFFNQANKNLIFIYIPTWTFLKENIFDALLFESPHLFDKILITNSKHFTFKHDLYDDTQISEDIPQIYLMETNPEKEKTIYNMSYFRFADDFSKYLRNRKDPFKKPELMENLTYVTTVNSKNFEDKIIKDNTFKEFMIEIKHEGCPTCYMLGKMFDHISQKFKKHKYDNKFKFFRVDTHNDLPYLGEFAATPTYLFGRKNEKGEITFISQIEKQEFLFKMKKLSNFDFSKVRYHPNIGFGFYVFQRNEFLKPNYDPDLDLTGFNI